MPKTLTQDEYIEIMSKLKSRKLRGELKRYVEEKVIPWPLWEKIDVYFREHYPETSTPGTPPKDEIL